MRCWGFNGDGQLGDGNTKTIGDDEAPGSVQPVNLGAGRTATAISASTGHTCALRDDREVLCWGFGGEGRLGYGNTNSIGDNEAPGSVEPLDLGAGGTARAISAGDGHSCALLDDGSVRCWGYSGNGELGYGNTDTIGDDETPGSFAPVKLGPGRTARAISAGYRHTCALLDDGNVRCWGYGGTGQLGIGDGFEGNIGDDETPGSVEPVRLGSGRTATAISAGYRHTCALLDEGSVRCWGYGRDGRLGYGNTTNIGVYETPDTVGPVDLGPGRTAMAISAGDDHTCAVLDEGSVRCWGYGGDGRLGYGNQNRIGDSEAPGSVGPVGLGPGRTAMAISAGSSHTCARLEDGGVLCWGYGGDGRLGYCNQNSIGDDEAPGSVGPVNVTGSSGCPSAGGAPPPESGGGDAPPPPDASPTPQTGDSRAERRGARYRRAFAAQASRKHELRGCYARVGRHAESEKRFLRRRGSSRRRVRAKRHIKRHRSRGRRTCARRHGRMPGRVTRLSARAVAARKVVLSFPAAGTAGRRPPAAREYIVKQSRRPIRGKRRFRRAQTLCRGRCRFDVRLVGATIKLTVTDLRPRTTYYYSVAARDNVSGRQGQRSPTTKARTRR